MNKVERLIKYLVPSRYELELEINPAKTHISGTARITGQSKASTIKLHAKDMQIEELLLGGTHQEFSHDGEVITAQDVPIGEVDIKVTFNYRLNAGMHGAYVSTYKHGGKTERIVTTQFESHYAREAFPCVDEPEAKAEFNLTIITPDKNDTVVSNMPVAEELQNGGVRQARFEPTPRMSTYLLAFCVGKFQKKQSKTSRGIDVCAYATLAQPARSLDFALDIATRCLDFYENYFGVPYPLPKCDHIALPDFEAGAMENWGLITYREACMLADPETTSLDDKRWIATVITHELAHMWFGDLVTMKWWDDLWLNESFATVMEYVAVDALEPKWNIWQDFDTSYVIAALRRDATDGVQPVHQDVAHPDEIQSLFDPAIVYGKGACLMRMSMHMIGEDAFQRGLRNYFKKHQYGNTTGDDLWAALGAETDFDVRDFMNQWVNRPGYPVVNVKLADGQLTLEQRRFLLGRGMNLIWPIPLDSNLSKLPPVLGTRKFELSSAEITASTLVQLNQSRTGHFLVNYDAASLDNLLSGLDSANSDAYLRLMNEQALLAKARLVDTLQIFKLLDRCAASQDDGAWSSMSLALRDLAWFVDVDTPEEAALKRYRIRLAAAQFERLGWQPRADEPNTDTKLRNIVAGLMIASGDQKVIDQAVQSYNTAKSVEELGSNQRLLILAAKVRYDRTDALVDELLKAYSNTVFATIRDDIGAALAASEHSATIQKLLEASLDKSIVRLQDTVSLAAQLLRNRRATDTAWSFYREHWDWFERETGNDKKYADLPRYMAAALFTEQHLAEFKDFFQPMMDQPALKRNIEVGIREIQERVDLIASEAPKVREYLLGL